MPGHRNGRIESRRSAEIHLGRGPLERHARAGIQLS
jgi:hypothetical protein